MIASLTRRAPLTVAAVLAVLGCGAQSTARAAEPSRAADLDGLCAWGRLSDGRGHLVRCLTRDEAMRMRDAPQPAPSAEAKAPPPGSPSDVTSTPPGPVINGEPPKPKDASQPTESHAQPSPAEVPPGPVPVAPVATPDPLEVEVGPVTADAGGLPDAQKGFSKARDRFAACVEKNGGLTADRGSVELRFLVQALGRAEGVSVKKHRGMSEAAAKCIANVVDRRYVGYPEEPAVGATVVVTLSKKKR